MPTRIDEVGQTHGVLTVYAFAGYDRRGAYWWCRCICGREVRVRGDNLRSGNTKSCHRGDCNNHRKAALAAKRLHDALSRTR